MSKIWVPKDPELLKSWLDAILDEASDELSEWENNFIESIQIRLNAGWQLSQRREEILERIYAEKTS